MKNKNCFKNKIWMMVGLVSVLNAQEGSAEGYFSSIRNWFSPSKEQEVKESPKKKTDALIQGDRSEDAFRNLQEPYQTNKKTSQLDKKISDDFEKCNRFFADEKSSTQYKGWVKEGNNAPYNVFSDLLNAEKSIEMINHFIINEAKNLKNKEATYDFMDIENYIDGGASVLQNLFLQSVPVNGRFSSKEKIKDLRKEVKKTKLNMDKYKNSFNVCLDKKENNCDSKYIYLLNVFNQGAKALKEPLFMAYDMVKRNLGRLKEDYAEDINALTQNRQKNTVTMSGYVQTLKKLIDLVSKRRPLSGDAKQINELKDTAQLFHQYAERVQKILDAKRSSHKETSLQEESSIEDLLKDI